MKRRVPPVSRKNSVTKPQQWQLCCRKSKLHKGRLLPFHLRQPFDGTRSRSLSMVLSLRRAIPMVPFLTQPRSNPYLFDTFPTFPPSRRRLGQTRLLHMVMLLARSGVGSWTILTHSWRASDCSVSTNLRCTCERFGPVWVETIVK
jgi:hypothetical protein